MKIPIEPGSVKITDIVDKLKEKYPDYMYNVQGGKVCWVGKNKSTGVAIMAKKNSIWINGQFPTMGGRILFALAIVLTGAVIAFLVYLSVHKKNHKAMEKELAEYLEAAFTGKPESTPIPEATEEATPAPAAEEDPTSVVS